MNQSPLHQPAGKRPARWPFLLAAIAMACTLTACGGGSDDDDSSSTTPPPGNGQTTQPPAGGNDQTPPATTQPVLHCAP